VTKLTADEQLGADLSEFYDDPLGYVMYVFPWETELSIQQVKLAPKYRERYGCEFGPDVWACEFLEDLGAEIAKRDFNGRDAVPPIRFSTASGHGIGKTVLVAWLIKFILDTRPDSIGTVTAMTAEQLKVKTWSELGRWHRMSLTSHWFDYTSGRGAMALSSNRLDSFGNSLKDKWKCTAQTCREENSEAFAGQHAANSTSFYIFDEASGVPNKIFEVREGGTTDGEPMTFDFGNPTRNSGRFFEQCQGRFTKHYIVRSIDSRDVAITNKELFQEWIDSYGIDSDFVRVRIRGMFPSAGSLQFIPSDLVDAAMERVVAQEKGAPLVIGVDVARYGDDEAVVYPRIGYDARSFPPKRYRQLDTVQLAGRVVQEVAFFRQMGVECAAIFVDATGSAGVADTLRHLGYPVFDVLFGNSAIDNQRYRYVGDEIWGRLKEALPKLMLPGATEASGIDLKMQLTQREFGYTLQGNKIHLESKRDMKTRLGGAGASPDIADALACTFAHEVAPVANLDYSMANQTQVKHDYDPLQDKF
jgi:hypothetical protein